MSEGKAAAAAGEKKSRRWAALREAFVSAVAASKGEDQLRSSFVGHTLETRRTSKDKDFRGFLLFPRKERPWRCRECSDEDGAVADMNKDGGAQLATYQLPGGKKIMTKEMSSVGSDEGGRRVITLEQVFSHRIHGVDNTGNVKVWPSEQSLLRLVLSREFVPSLAGARVLELGAGMSGLAGLGIAACSDASDIVISDGNPESVKNLQTCVELNESEKLFGNTQVSALKLVWDRKDSDGMRKQLLRKHGGGFDLIISSDCLFFKDFHLDLISTVRELLKPGGRAVFVQPQRGGTLNLFLERVASMGRGEREADRGTDDSCGEGGARLEARLVERYDERIWSMHEEYLSSSSGRDGGSAYVPDRHLPLLVEVFHRKAGVSVAGNSFHRDIDSETEWLKIFPIVDEDAPRQSKDADKASETRNRSAETFAEKFSGFYSASLHPKATVGSTSTGLSTEAVRGKMPPACEGGADEIPPEKRERRPAERPDLKMHAVYEELAEKLRTKLRARRDEDEVSEEGITGKQWWIALAGAPGSGKTTLATEVCRRVSAEFPAVCVPMDGFHLYRRELDAMPDPGEAYRKRGAHWTFDGKRFLRELKKAKVNASGSFPGFDHAAGDPVEDEIKVEARHALVIVEGNYLLLRGVQPWEGARGLFDETWAIRCPVETCGERVRIRHIKTGLSDAEARARVESNDGPNAKLIEELCPWDDVDLVIDSL